MTNERAGIPRIPSTRHIAQTHMVRAVVLVSGYFSMLYYSRTNTLY